MPLSYPVDLSEKYTVFNTDIGEPLRDGKGRLLVKQVWPTADGFPPPNLNPKIKILLEVRNSKPVYDANTQKVVADPVVYDIVEETATYGWTVEPLSQNELDIQADNMQRDIKLNSVGGSVASLRNLVSALQGITVTTENSVTILQSIVDNVAVVADRFADLIEGQRLDQ